MSAELIGLMLGCFALGAVARRSALAPRETPKVLNLWVLWVALPALVLKTVHAVPLDGGVLAAAVVLWAAFALCAGAAVFAVRTGLTSAPVAGAVALSAGLGNTAFLGVPLVEALGGSAAVGPAVLIDQLGSFLALAVGAVPFAMALGGAAPTPRLVVQRLVTFPPFVALVAALALRGLVFPFALDAVLGRLAATLTPLALVSVGWQLEFAPRHAKPLAIGLTWKLLGAPALMLGVLCALGDFSATDRVAVAQAAMAPMVTAAVLASEHRLAAEVSATLAALGAALSFVTVPMWWTVAEALARSP